MVEADDRFERGMETFRALHSEAAAALAPIAPDLMRCAAEFPFGDVYQRSGLAKRERQVATLAALATRGDAPSQLALRIEIALRLGVTKEEIAEVFIQLAPYAGFPTAINAAMILRETLDRRDPGA